MILGLDAKSLLSVRTNVKFEHVLDTSMKCKSEVICWGVLRGPHSKTPKQKWFDHFKGVDRIAVGSLFCNNNQKGG